MVQYMELNSRYIGSLIKAMRKRIGITQYELADRIGVGNKTISKWEQGRGIPDISLLYQLSLVLDMDIESILAGNLDDLGREWTGIVYIADIENELVSERQDLEYITSMFLLVGIRDIVIMSSKGRMHECETFLKEYREKGFLKKTWCTSSFEELAENIGVEDKHICFLYQPAFLYGMHLTRYMRRAMLREKVTVLALRQGKNSFMHPICYDNRFLYVYSEAGTSMDNEWRMFPMIFGCGKNIAECINFIVGLGDNEIDTDALLSYFKEVYVEPMERGMLAFSMKTESDRTLTGQVLSGIEKSQHIKIGSPEEIMAVRGWR